MTSAAVGQQSRDFCCHILCFITCHTFPIIDRAWQTNLVPALFYSAWSPGDNAGVNFSANHRYVQGRYLYQTWHITFSAKEMLISCIGRWRGCCYGQPQFKSQQWISVRTPGDIAIYVCHTKCSRFCGDKNCQFDTLSHDHLQPWSWRPILSQTLMLFCWLGCFLAHDGVNPCRRKRLGLKKEKTPSGW